MPSDDADPRVQAARDALVGDDGATEWRECPYCGVDLGPGIAHHCIAHHCPDEDIERAAREIEALHQLADAAVLWLDQGQMDREERLLKAAREIKRMREAR